MNINQRKYEVKISNYLIFLLYTFCFLFFISPAFAIVDPLVYPNNKFGIHIISATADEITPAQEMVNSGGGDWGYVTVLIERNDRKQDKWQTFFNDLRRKHLIPIIRIATEPEGSNWKIPYEGEEQAWADFLDNLNWPTKNRYVTIYNEPNQGQEWAGRVDPRSYAQVLDKTITALKNKNPDFFVLNAGFDASAPSKPPLFQDEASFMREMNEVVPGIFNKLDGWVSHSYPNPAFAGSPHASGQGTVRTWIWEQRLLRSLGINKDLPVFITETGWKHAEGKDYDKSLPTAQTVGGYLQIAFENAWSSNQIVAITPFLLNYQDAPFDHFSFKKVTGEPQNVKILGAEYPDYYPHYQTLLNMPKNGGRPFQENKGQLIKGEIYHSLVIKESYTIPLTFKNTGQSIWNEYEQMELRATVDQPGIEIPTIKLSSRIEPGQEANFNLVLKTSQPGIFKVSLQLFSGDKPFDQNPHDFTVEVKAPVILVARAKLLWKDNPEGEYFLETLSTIVKTINRITLNNAGETEPVEARYLLPDNTFQFTLSKPFYKPKTIQASVQSGINNLEFGTLEPDIPSAILQPTELWNLLPFSN